MIGIIHKVLFDMVEDQGGREAITAVKKRAGVSPFRAYFLNMDYSDQECLDLIDAACEHFGLSIAQGHDLYAKYFLDYALRAFPRFFEQARSAREFLELQPKIHAKFADGKSQNEDLERVSRKFRPIDDGSDDLVIRYRSQNSLCMLYEALARRLFDHYGEEGLVTQDRCVHRGDPCCDLRIRFEGRSEDGLRPMRKAS